MPELTFFSVISNTIRPMTEKKLDLPITRSINAIFPQIQRHIRQTA